MISSLRFEEQELTEKLNRLDARARLIFAVSCAERLFPAYVLFSEAVRFGDSAFMRSCLDSLWLDVSAHTIQAIDFQARLDQCMLLIPNENEVWSEQQPCAEDAGAALAYALRTKLTGGAQEAAWAGRRAFEAMHYLAERRLDAKLDTSVNDAQDHEYVQTELGYQQEVLGLFSNSVSSGDLSDLMISELKNKSSHAYAKLF